MSKEKNNKRKIIIFSIVLIIIISSFILVYFLGLKPYLEAKRDMIWQFQL